MHYEPKRLDLLNLNLQFYDLNVNKMLRKTFLLIHTASL